MEARILPILMAEDDPEDRFLAREAWGQCRAANDLHFVKDGEELMDYLHHEGRYSDEKQSPTPGMILLDLNMPKKDGLTALKEIKSDPKLKTIPVVVLTTSKAERDLVKSYDLGANSFITKPVDFMELVDVLKTLQSYWFKTVDLSAYPKGRYYG